MRTSQRIRRSPHIGRGSASAALLIFLGACAPPPAGEDDGEAEPGRLERPETVTREIRTADLVELHSYWNPALGDNALSSDPAGIPGYGRFRSEGLIGRPDLPRPPGTTQLFTWYSPSRGDYFSTTDPTWTGWEGISREGYDFVRMEGWVFTDNVAGTAELELWWDPDREDSFTTTDPNWTRDADGRRTPNYGRARAEGFVLRSAGSVAPPSAFHHGTMGGGPAGERDLLIIQTTYRGAPFRHSTEHFDRLFFGPGFPNLRDYMHEMSQGRFTWRRGDNWRIDAPDDPDTAADEGDFRTLFAADDPTMAFVYLDAPTASPEGETQRLAAFNGGGEGTVVTRGLAEWEIFNLADLNGGLLVSNDVVALKTYTRHYFRQRLGELRADATSRTGVSARFIVLRPGGGGVNPGDRIRLLSVATGRFVRQTETGFDVLGADGEPSTLFTIRKGSPPPSYQNRAVVEAAVRAGRSFAPFDRNHDGVIAAEEVAIFTIGSGPDPVVGAGTRGVAELTVPGSGGLRLAGRMVVGMGEGGSLMSIAHELLHTLGAVDLYGASGLSQNLTLMGATMWPTEDVLQVFHADPWHKLRLGWALPEVVPLNGAGDETTLMAAGSTGGGFKGPVLIYDARRYDVQGRKGEYFLVEYRARGLASTPDHHDEDSTGDGIVIWSVETDGAGNPLIIPALSGAGIDASVFTLGAPDGRRGGTAVWTESHGSIALRYRDGSDAGVRVRVGARPAGAHLLSFDWSPTGSLRPRLDESDLTVYGTVPFRVDGAFPASAAGVSAWMRPRVFGPPVRLEINYGPGRLLLRRPDSAPTATTQEIWIENDGLRSNLLRVEVR
jgi:M6 family metalloprotease-like protein